MSDEATTEREESAGDGRLQDAVEATQEQAVASPREALHQWIVERRPEGYCPAQIFNAILVAGGWTREVAVEAMQQAMGDMVQPHEFDALLRGTPMADLAGSPSRLIAEGHEVQVLFEMQNPRIVVFGGFMTDEECDQVVEIARPRLERSGVMGDPWEDGGQMSDIRTSYGTFLQRGEFDVCNRIDARAQALLNWPTEFTEDLQVLHYGQGAEYQPHHDYFDATEGPWTPPMKRGGNRCGTLLMYLNTPERGGGTVFPDVPLEVRARKGTAVYFSYPIADPSTRTLHGGLPVIEGEKWAAVKWFRQGPHR